MRQLILKASKDHEKRINESVEKHGGKNTLSFPIREGAAVMTFLPNRKVNDLLNDLSDIDELKVSLQSSGAIALYPPQNKAPEKAADVKPKSSLEIYIEGIQSVGSWFGLVGYSFAAGIIVWIGLYTGMSYLLVAAMLVAPFAGPAMNAALGTAVGRIGLLKSSILRYVGAMAVGTAASFLLTALFPITSYTNLMISVSHVSIFAVLLPLTAGFAGAINVSQSEQDSLVSGAAVGILVAASLAPPVGLLGIGLYMLDSTLISSSLFRILLQLFGIHISATAVFYFYGKLSYKGVRFVQGKRVIRTATLVLVILAIGGMMYWQFSKPPFLRKASLKSELVEYVNKRMEKAPDLKVVSRSVGIGPNELQGKTMVFFDVTVLPTDSLYSEKKLKKAVIDNLKAGFDPSEYNIYPVYSVTVAED